ncbi:hypothetical protein GGP76_003099 [Salinibacter ruber]|nr:hypothetical protein [Salinibacter ruber]
MDALGELAPGDATTVVVKRGDQTLKAEVQF